MNWQRFFKHGSSEFWLKFLHQQASTVPDTIKMLEVDNINFSEVSEIIYGLKEKYKNRLQQDYVPLILRRMLTALAEEGQIDEKYCLGHIRNFYSNVLEYLNRYCEQYSKFEVFQWTERKKMLSRPRLTKRAISAEAHRTCYLGRGSHNVLSQTRFFFFKFYSGSPAHALIKPLFLQNWCLKIMKNITYNSFTMILTIYYKSPGGSKNFPSQFGA